MATRTRRRAGGVAGGLRATCQCCGCAEGGCGEAGSGGETGAGAYCRCCCGSSGGGGDRARVEVGRDQLLHLRPPPLHLSGLRPRLAAACSTACAPGPPARARASAHRHRNWGGGHTEPPPRVSMGAPVDRLRRGPPGTAGPSATRSSARKARLCVAVPGVGRRRRTGRRRGRGHGGGAARGSRCRRGGTRTRTRNRREGRSSRRSQRQK